MKKLKYLTPVIPLLLVAVAFSVLSRSDEHHLPHLYMVSASASSASSSAPGTGFNTHLAGTQLTLNYFKADVDDLVAKHQKWIRLNLFDGITSQEGASGNPQIVWDQTQLSNYDQAISYAQSKGLKIFLVTNTPTWAQNLTPDAYQSITTQYYQFLGSRYQGKVAVWQVFNEANVHDFKSYAPITSFSSQYLASLSTVIQTAASAIRQSNPSALITTNAGGYPDTGSLYASWAQFFSGLKSVIDVASIDLYPDTNSTTIQGLPAMIQGLKTQLGMDIMVAEAGLCSDSNHPGQTQAASLSQIITMLKLSAADVILVYEMRDENTAAGDCQNTFGIKQTDGTHKPSYASVMDALSSSSNTVEPNQILNTGTFIWANNGNTVLAMQTDGVLAIYDANWNALWDAPGTWNPNGKNYAIMNPDGNFCVYPNHAASGGTALWCTNTSGHSGAWLTVQDDGNVAVQVPPPWASGTTH